MILGVPSRPGLRIVVTSKPVDFRKGMDSLTALVTQALALDPFICVADSYVAASRGGALFAFRGRNAGLIKVLWHDGIGLCLLTKRLERGQFIWPSTTTTGSVALSTAQLATLLEGCEWRAPVHGRRPELAG
jgi:transposase